MGGGPSIVQANRGLKNGTRSEYVTEFLKRHGLMKLELESTGSLTNDMALKLAVWEEKREAMKLVMSMMGAADRRVMSWYSQLIELNLKLADLEREDISQGLNPLRDPDYVNAQKMISEIRKQFDKMQFDVQKEQISRRIQKESDDDILFENPYAVQPDKSGAEGEMGEDNSTDSKG
jgi:hypothetical protein